MVHEKLLNQLKQYRTGEFSAQELEQFVVSHLQQILDSNEVRAIELANDLDALFIEASEGLLRSDELHAELAGLYNREISTIWVEVGFEPVRASADRTVHKKFGEPQFVTSSNTHLQVA